MSIEITAIIIGILAGMLCSVCPSLIPNIFSPVGFILVLVLCFGLSSDTATCENIIAAAIVLIFASVFSEVILSKAIKDKKENEKAQEKKYRNDTSRRMRNRYSKTPRQNRRSDFRQIS